MKSSLIELMGIWVVVSGISGLVIFSVMKIFDRFYSAQSASDKYQKGIIGLVFFFLLNLAGTYYFHNTFIEENGTLRTEENGSVKKEQAEIQSIFKVPQNEIKNESQYSKSLNFESIYKYVGILWLIGALLFSLKMVGGYFYTRNLISSSHRSIPQNWHDFIILQLDKLQIEKSIKVFESEKVSSALTFGFLKPVIVVPLGFFMTLPTDQIEAVLLHEIYHIKHKDYLINLLIMAFEVIFFYHPLMWWLAKNIRVERENRCDDQVTQITDKQVYAHALLNMESYRQSLSYAIPFSNKKSNLKMRIMRIFEQKPERNIGLKPFLSLLAIVVFLMGFTFYKLEEPKNPEKAGKINNTKSEPVEKALLQESDEPVFFKSENPQLGVVLEMTKSTLIAKSENENVKLYLDGEFHPLNKKILKGARDIASMYVSDKESAYYFFSYEYFKSHNRAKWEKEHESRTTYAFDSQDGAFIVKPAKNNSTQAAKINNEERTGAVSKNVNSINSIAKIENRPADITEINIYGPIDLQFKDKTSHLGDTNSLEVLKKLVKHFGTNENADVQIKIDGKPISAGADFAQELGERKIQNIRIVLASKDATEGVIEIITDDIKEMKLEEVPADKGDHGKLLEVAENVNTIRIEVNYETNKLNYSGQMTLDEKRENVLEVLGISNSDPLYVVDGEIIESKNVLKSIDPKNIKSITVLKDKKATNKYEKRGENGVVEIYLKKE